LGTFLEAEPVRILLVEDNPGDARLLRETLLDSPGYRHTLAHVMTLGEGVARLRDGGVDLLLLDLSLPDAHGLDTVARAAAAAPQVPIVVLTGLDDETVAVESLKAGAQDYLTKGTLDPVLLVRTLRHACERKRMEHEREELLLREREARTAAEAAERRARFLAEASEVLSGSLDAAQALDAVCRLASGRLASGCAVYLLDEDGGELRLCASAHANPARDRALPAPDDAGPAVIPAGAPVAVALRAGEAVCGTAPGGAEFYVAAPLVVRAGAIGVLLLTCDQAAAPGDATLAAEVAHRAALAVDNARLYEHAQQAVRARGDVLRVVSHDLGNSLSALAVNLTVLIRTLPEQEGWPEKARARMEAMRGLVTQMQRLRQDLLDAVAVDARQLAVERSRHDPWSILQQVLEEFSALAGERALTLELETHSELPEVMADRLRVLQVFGNLVGNAAKFTPEGGRIVVGAAAAGDEIVFRVTDTGRGIVPENLPHVFDRFWKTGDGNQQGAGLGLAITKGIVEAHGGRIWAEAEPGVGSTFFFTLPVA
jgi:signal transduction histidine kinase/CheY-like chemotaxis protein